MKPQAKVADYTYDLPDTRIAVHPLKKRDASKLLVYNDGITDATFADVSQHLPADTLLVQNDTRVVPARLVFLNDNGARIEIFCLNPTDTDPSTGLSQTGEAKWNCLIGNKKRWKQQVLNLEFEGGVLYAEQAGDYIRFSWQPETLTFAEVLEAVGRVPLPPYIKRELSAEDRARYQTIMAAENGSVAAPTASLHFTETVHARLAEKGIERLPLTLHVGAGTFLPVKTEAIAEHNIHAESFAVSRLALQKLIDHKGPIVASGTTVCRTLETLAWLGVKLDTKLGQWEAYEMTAPQQPLLALADWMDRQGMEVLSGSTQILIAPGYRWQLCDGLITNFHQPNSTLLMLVASFVGSEWQEIYQHALENDYRFLSYGDASLLWRSQ